MIKKATVMDLMIVLGSINDTSKLDVAALTNRILCGDCFSVVSADDTVIGIVGADIIFPRVAEVWSILTPLVRTYPFGFIKDIKTLLKCDKFDRLQMLVKASEPVHQKFAEYLGFLEEGTMRRTGYDGVDYLMYGRVL